MCQQITFYPLRSITLSDSSTNRLLDENLYWLPDSHGIYSGLQKMPKANIIASQKNVEKDVIEVTLRNTDDKQFAFFISVSLVNGETGKRILPVFCNNNYISIPPGQQRTVRMEYTPQDGVYPVATVEGWNIDYKVVDQLNKK